MLPRHRLAALYHFLCAALASLILRKLSSSAIFEARRPFFSGSRLGECLRLQKMTEKRMMMMAARATDKVRMMVVL